MDFDDVLERRYSVRDFSDKKVEGEKLDKILQAMRIAPTGKNDQANRIFVVDKEEDLERIDQSTNSRYKAPVVLIVGFDKRITPAKRKRGSVDCAIAVSYGMLEATNQGLGTCWVAAFDEEKIAKDFDIDPNIELVSLLPIGYASHESKPSERHFDRKEISEIVRFVK